jgi:hypothetical protein
MAWVTADPTEVSSYPASATASGIGRRKLPDPNHVAGAHQYLLKPEGERFNPA